MRLTFKKLAGRWYIDMPYEDDIADLEMVCGADLLLKSISPILTDIKIIEIVSHKTGNELRKLDEDEMGCTYYAETVGFKGEIWLCNVTKLVLGRFPDVINFETCRPLYIG